MPLAILSGHEPIHSRLKFPQYITFPNGIVLPSGFNIYHVNAEDIPFVLPALFVWVDLGIQSLKPDTTTSHQIFFLDYQICNIPTRDFKEKDIKYSALLMMSPNLTVNRNFLTDEDVNSYLNTLTGYVKRFKDFMTGENRNG
jgi:hypothetical protein